ncbi:MAG: ribonuclease HII [Clostridia bacterium]|nr:ribonuclease HII [Clostridia bacterium]MBQ8334436.1 ribonuclease HII [Clostridia bacterium]MBQ8368860.1 ribonuclease HII [Clostridia bacterium]MBQ8513490.1 ribonuclease HII [Clostridia bacterium]
MTDYTFDAGYAKQYGVVCGTDEAGRGPLAGSVVAAAVVLPDGIVIEGLDDSKKLTEKKREKLFDVIINSAAAYGIAEATETEIDETNILAASLLAMRRAADQVKEKLAEKGMEIGVVLIDGNRQTDFGVPSVTVVHGDAISQSIAAASVLAKVTRDRQMLDMDARYPAYGFAVHKGYPTPAHKLAVFEHGPCPIHRKSFLGFLERDREKLTAALEKKRNG